MMKILDVSAAAARAESQRLNTVASEPGQCRQRGRADGQPYKARAVVFQTAAVARPRGPAAGRRARQHDERGPVAGPSATTTRPTRWPTARATSPSNVNVIEEMVNMISASRSYQNNVEVMNTAKQLMLKTLQLGQADRNTERPPGRQRTRLDRDTAAASASADRRRDHERPRPSRADRFLKLLVAQMKNQDPLNPLDNAQVTTQMAQINTVERHREAELDRRRACRAVHAAAGGAGRVAGRPDVLVAGNKLTSTPRRGIGAGRLGARQAPRRRQSRSWRRAAPSSHAQPRAAGAGVEFDWPRARRRADGGLTFRVTARPAASPRQGDAAAPLRRR